ncbi:MAG: PqqD family peptide modification chaperone [Paracoccaceae bacterium]
MTDASVIQGGDWGGKAARRAATADGPLFSPYWYKIANLKPRLRPGVTITRRVEQGEIWHILSAPETNRHFRLDAAGYALVGALDGRATLEEIWRTVLHRFGDDAPGQDEALRLLGQLHQANALNAGAMPSLSEAARRARRVARQRVLGQLKNPLFVRFHLFDPQWLIELTYPLVRPMFGRVGFLLWLLIVGWLGVMVIQNWDELAATTLDRALAADNLLIAALVFPVAKFIHELAHGWAVHHYGGEVRDCGIMFLVFLPAPYVDASAAGAFPGRFARVFTSAAGMMAELVLAAGAMAVWLTAETGLVTAIAFNVMLVAGISTLLFNGNPLLRFDAYFMLCDAIGVQNLGTRSGKWWSWLVHRYGFGIEEWENPMRTRTEGWWFTLYQPASYAYRVFLTLSIALFVASEYPVVGLTLATWAITTTFGFPFAKGVWQVITSPRVARHRRRAVLVTAAMIGLPVLVLFGIPIPHGTVAPAVVIQPEGTRLAAPAQAQVAEVLQPAGTSVAKGAPLITMEAPLLEAELAVTVAELATAQAELASEEGRSGGAAEAAAIRAEIGYLQRERQILTDDAEALEIFAEADGQLVARADVLLPGRLLSRGAEVGALIPLDVQVELRAAIPAWRIEEVMRAPARVEVRHPGRLFDPTTGEVTRISPEATRILPYVAFAATAGGPLTMDPSDPDGQRAAEPVHFAQIETTWPLETTAIGALIWVRFDHGRAPLAPRLWRAARQVFLTRLAI